MRILVVVVIGLIALGAFLALRHHLSLDTLAAQEKAWLSFKDEHLLLCWTASSLLYILVAALSLPFATVLTVIYGHFFGFWLALPLVNASATIGATLNFMISRYLLRDFVERKYGEQLTAVQRELARDGVFYLFMLRLSPIMPFFVVNPVMGVTKMSGRAFFVVSMIGMLPGGAIYTLFGSQLPSLEVLRDQGWSGAMNPTLFVSFVLIGFFPLIVRKLTQWFRRTERAKIEG